MTSVDSYRESTEIDSTQVLESMRLIVTSSLGIARVVLGSVTLVTP